MVTDSRVISSRSLFAYTWKKCVYVIVDMSIAVGLQDATSSKSFCKEKVVLLQM